MADTLNINKIIWKSEYNIGNLKLDNEHQQLFLLARKALCLIDNKNKDTPQELKKIIKDLYGYVKTHFKNEEIYMDKIKYPHLQEHQLIHEDMLHKLNQLIQKLNTLELHIIEQQLFGFIEEYFIKHIILEDKKIHLWNTPLQSLRKSFGWKEIYSVGNDRIDDEHKKLFDIAQEAFSIVDNSKRNYKIKEILTNLYNYMQIHFEHEEDYMQEIDYPKQEEHKQLHQKIANNINNLVKRLPSLNVELFEKELAQLIDIALVQHIIQEDRKIIEYL